MRHVDKNIAAVGAEVLQTQQPRGVRLKKSLLLLLWWGKLQAARGASHTAVMFEKAQRTLVHAAVCVGAQADTN